MLLLSFAGKGLIVARNKLYLARERGFCGGVRSALEMLEKLLREEPSEPVYVLYELVHNRHVSASCRRRGVRFVENLSEVPPGARLLLGAHGVPPETENLAAALTGKLCDACCPLVRARQRAAAALTSGDTLVLIGHRGHPEVDGILGWSNAGRSLVVQNAAEAARITEAAHPVLISQTTFSSEELEKCRQVLARRFPDLEFHSGLCRASSMRQRGVRELAALAETVVVAGSAHSSNARRLCETAESCGAEGVLVECAEELPKRLFGLERVGLTAGASTPDEDFETIAANFADAGFEITDLKDQQPEKGLEND